MICKRQISIKKWLEYTYIVVVGSTNRVVIRKTLFQLNAFAFNQMCGGFQTKLNLEYNWTVYENNVENMALQNEATVDMSIFLLSPFRFNVNTMYTVRLKVSNTETKLSLMSYVLVSCVQGILQVIIDGGNQHNLIQNKSIELSGRSSFDEDKISSTVDTFTRHMYTTLLGLV